MVLDIFDTMRDFFNNNSHIIIYSFLFIGIVRVTTEIGCDIAFDKNKLTTFWDVFFLFLFFTPIVGAIYIYAHPKMKMSLTPSEKESKIEELNKNVRLKKLLKKIKLDSKILKNENEINKIEDLINKELMLIDIATAKDNLEDYITS